MVTLRGWPSGRLGSERGSVYMGNKKNGKMKFLDRKVGEGGELRTQRNVHEN